MSDQSAGVIPVSLGKTIPRVPGDDPDLWFLTPCPLEVASDYADASERAEKDFQPVSGIEAETRLAEALRGLAQR